MSAQWNESPIAVEKPFLAPVPRQNSIRMDLTPM